jgi:ribosome recycling factor
MSQDIIQNAKSRMNTQLDRFKEDLRGIRAGKASPHLIESITVEAYGSQMKLKELGTITSPEPRQLVVHPFDAANIALISKAINQADLGLRSAAEGKTLRVFFPELTQERRKELVKQTHAKREEAKIVIRNIRRDENELVKKKKNEGTIPEDDLKKLEKQIQDLTDKFCKEIDDLAAAKEKEISTV